MCTWVVRGNDSPDSSCDFIYVTIRRETFIFLCGGGGLCGGRSVSAAGAACAGWQGLFGLGQAGWGDERVRVFRVRQAQFVFNPTLQGGSSRRERERERESY